MDRRQFLLAAAATPFALGRAIGGTPVALVTADLESRVVAVELTNGRLHRTLPTLPGPRSIEAVGVNEALVAHTAHGAVSIVDGVTLRVRHVLHDFGEPRYTAASPDGRHAFVTDSRRGEVVTVDVRHGRVVGRLELDGPARHVTLDRTGRVLWTALGSKAEEVAIVDVSDPRRPRLERRLRPPFLAHDVGFAPESHRVWVSSGDRGRIEVYDAASGRTLFGLDADAPPQHVTFAGGVAYVTSGRDGTLRLHHLRDGRLLRTTAIPVGSYNVQRGFGRILTPSLDRGTLCVVSERGAVVERVRVARSSHDACFAMAR